MEKTLTKFRSFEEAERADRDFYKRLTPLTHAKERRKGAAWTETKTNMNKPGSIIVVIGNLSTSLSCLLYC